MDTLLPAKKIVILESAGLQKLKSGIELPNINEKSKPELGIVIAIGEGNKPLSFQKGDKVVYRKYMDNKIQIGAKEYNFIDFKDILAVVKPEETK